MKSKILLISGRQGSGKTSLVKTIAPGWGQIFKFADPLYAMHDHLLPFIKSLGLRPETMEKDGELLQILGKEYGRDKLGENCWVHVLRARIDNFRTTDINGWVLIDDARFKNEFDAFPDAHRIRLEAPEEVRKERCSYWRENTAHLSETDLDEYVTAGKFDLVIDTSGTKDQTLDALAKYLVGFLHEK